MVMSLFTFCSLPCALGERAENTRPRRLGGMVGWKEGPFEDLPPVAALILTTATRSGISGHADKLTITKPTEKGPARPP